MKQTKFYVLGYGIVCPIFGLKKPKGKNDEVIVSELEWEASDLLEP